MTEIAYFQLFVFLLDLFFSDFIRIAKIRLHDKSIHNSILESREYTNQHTISHRLSNWHMLDCIGSLDIKVLCVYVLFLKIHYLGCGNVNQEITTTLLLCNIEVSKNDDHIIQLIKKTNSKDYYSHTRFICSFMRDYVLFQELFLASVVWLCITNVLVTPSLRSASTFLCI